MQGRRIPDDANVFAPGDYGRISTPASDRRLEWYARPPRGFLGCLSNHQVTEHEDGTITVSPSILIESRDEGGVVIWHGFLERGVWREC